MKKIFFALVMSCCFAQGAFADTSTLTVTCSQQFGQAVSNCAQSIQSLSQDQIPAAQKACVVAARAVKQACLSGITQCLSTCTSNYNSAVNTCNINYNPTDCGTDTVCQSLVQAELNSCLSDAQTAYNNCTANCQ